MPMSRETGNHMVPDDRFKLLTFTGSPAVGWKMKSEAGKPTGFIRPHTPSAVILKSLLDQFPGTKIEDLMNMDETLLQMIQVVDDQQGISQFERQHVNENVMQSKQMEKIQEQGGGSGPQIHSMQRKPAKKPSVPLHDATTFAKK